MKKITIAMVIGLLIFILSGCSGNPGASKEVEAEAEVKDAITQFYKERRNSPVEYSIEIFKIKPLEEDFLAVAQQRGEEGQPSLDLLLIQKKSRKYTVSKTGFGSIAISMGFSVNRVTYDNKNVIFGSLQDSTWIPETDERKEVNYSEVKAVFDNGKSISEKIKGDKAYLLIVDEVSGLKDLAFYNEKGQMEGTFNGLGIQIEEVDFLDTNNQQVSRKSVINLAAVIDEKLDAVISRNSRSSNPYDYIKGSKEYRDIVNLGQPAAESMLTKFEAGTENGLREYIMAIACSEILGEKPEDKEWNSGREWYEKHINSISVPEDFGFIMKFGTEGKNVLNTFEGAFTKDLVKAGAKTTKLLLTKEELQKIYGEMVKMDIWHNPERFKPSQEGHVITIVHPGVMGQLQD